MKIEDFIETRKKVKVEIFEKFIDDYNKRKVEGDLNA